MAQAIEDHLEHFLQRRASPAVMSHGFWAPGNRTSRIDQPSADSHSRLKGAEKKNLWWQLLHSFTCILSTAITTTKIPMPVHTPSATNQASSNGT